MSLSALNKRLLLTKNKTASSYVSKKYQMVAHEEESHHHLVEMDVHRAGAET